MVQGLVAEGTDGCLQRCFSAFMMRSQIAVGGSGEGRQQPAHTVCLRNMPENTG